MDPPVIMFSLSAFMIECVYNFVKVSADSYYHLIAKNIAHVQYDNAQAADKKRNWFTPDVCFIGNSYK
jgi:hypothetical protein